MQRRDLFRFALFALALQFASATIPPSGLFLCFGVDGHFDVEAPHSGHACHSPAGEKAATSDCHDVAIAGSQIAERPTFRPFAFMSPVLLATPPATTCLRFQAAARTSSCDSPAADVRRTVVLLV